MAETMQDTGIGVVFYLGRAALLKEEEVVVIPVGSGSGGVATTRNLLLPGILLSVGFIVMEAPGGGAATLSIGPTGAGDPNRYIDAASCDVLYESGSSPQDGDGLTLYPEYLKTGNTLDLTTDADVTTSQMLVKVVTTTLVFPGMN